MPINGNGGWNSERPRMAQNKGKDVNEKTTVKTDNSMTASTLWTSEDKYLQALLERIPLTFMVLDVDGTIKRINRTYPPHTPDQVIGRSIFDLVQDSQKKALKDALIAARTKQTKTDLVINLDRDGLEVPMHCICIPVVENGTTTELILLHDDISESVQAEEKLMGYQEKYTSLFDLTGDAIMFLNSVGFQICNQATLDLFGYKSRSDFLKKHPSKVSPPKQPNGVDSSVMAEKYIGKARLEGSCQFEWVHRRFDGTDFPADVKLTRAMIDGQAMVCATVRDLTESNILVHELADLNRLHEQILSSIYDGIIRLDVNGCIAFVNQASIGIFGYSLRKMIGEPFHSIAQHTERDGWSAKEDECSFCRDTRDGIVHHGVNALFRKSDGSLFHADYTISPIVENDLIAGSVISFRDITDRLIMETQLAQAQKLESIGQLAAGIAHEINTPIQYIGDNHQFHVEANNDLWIIINRLVELLAVWKEGGDPVEMLPEMEKAMESADLEYLREELPNSFRQTDEGVGRVRNIVQAMKSFSHPGDKEKEHTNINEAIDSTITVARSEWKYVSTIAKDLDLSIPLVPCLRGEFNQVILNLIINAAHAIKDSLPEKSSDLGMITLSTRQVDDSIEIRVRDTGTGIPEYARSRVFDPFYTTKKVGKGTGQGLAMAYSTIVDKHQGTISFETETGVGTTFVIRLPLSTNGEKTQRCL